jgi:branched-chain amino acid aminotransferase
MTADPRPDQIWIDGRLHPISELSVSPFDHGLTVGDGVFETLRTERGEPFAITRHLARLRRSADGLGLTVPFADDELRAAVRAVLDANGPAARRVRITLTGGISPLGSDRGGRRPTTVVATSEGRTWEPSAAVVTVPWRRNEHSPIAGLKTTSYAENVVALRQAQEAGADEAIFANTAGQLCEGTGTNIFVGLDGRLLTPPLSSGCLAGVTRQLVLEHTDAVEEPIDMGRLADVDEAFITSSTRDVQPVSRVDDRPLPQCPGPLTTAAQHAFQTLVERTTDP